MTRTYTSIMPKQGLISQFEFDKYKNQIYRSVMPCGCYDDENSVIDKWQYLNIDCVVCLCPRSEFLRKANREQDDIYGKNYKYINFPIQNYKCPDDFSDMKNLLRIIHNLLENNNKILIHCSAGIGRTGLFLSCLLLHLGYNSQDAVNITKKNIIKSFSNPLQNQYFIDFHKYHNDLDLYQ
jgi:protein tyrosine phosphatase